MLTFTRESSSEAQTLAIAGELAKCLRPRDVIALDGALGAGKTYFVRGLVAGLGGDPRQVSSPTFVLHQEYEVGRHGGTEARRHEGGESRRDEETERRREEVGGLPPSGRGAGGGEGEQPEILRVAHIDAYRMTGPNDLESIGWDELLEQDDMVIAIEWPTKVPQDALPRLRTIRIQFEVVGGAGESMRRLSFAIPSAIDERFASLQRQTRQCRTCGREITVDNAFFPFCSERCKLADLGAWFSEKYTITRLLDQRDIEEG